MTLDREKLLQTLSGYSEINRITAAERRSRLRTRTDRESLKIYTILYDTWSRTTKDGNWKRILQSRLQAHITLRAAFEIIARKRGDL